MSPKKFVYVSGNMEFQKKEQYIGVFFLFCSKILYGMETIYLNGKIPQIPLKIFKKDRVGGEKLGTVG